MALAAFTTAAPAREPAQRRKSGIALVLLLPGVLYLIAGGPGQRTRNDHSSRTRARRVTPPPAATVSAMRPTARFAANVSIALTAAPLTLRPGSLQPRTQG